MRACELDLLRANGAEPCLLMDTGGETGRISFSEAGLALRTGVNLLDNAEDFRDPVNQRGQTEYDNNGVQYNYAYGIDRWKSDGKVVLTSDGLQISAPHGYQALFLQFLEIERFEDHRIYTFSVLFSDGTLTTRTGEMDFSIGEYNTIFGDTIRLAMNAGRANITAIITVNENKTIYPKAAKLEPGPLQTLAHQDAAGNWVQNDPKPNKALELLKCQRYLRVYGRDSGEGFIAFMSGTNPDGSLKFQFNYPEMRANPTVINYNGLGTRSITDNADMAGSSYTFVADKTCMTIIDANSNFTSGKTYICGTSTHNGKIILSSEL